MTKFFSFLMASLLFTALDLSTVSAQMGTMGYNSIGGSGSSMGGHGSMGGGK
jgi:hypothetical protein